MACPDFYRVTKVSARNKKSQFKSFINGIPTYLQFLVYMYQILINLCSFILVCGGKFTAESGVISSPQYPDIYPVNMDCSYIIKPQFGSRVRLEFLSFDLEADYQCSFDYLQVSFLLIFLFTLMEKLPQ